VGVVLDARTVGSEDKPISGVCLLITIYKKYYDTSTTHQINNIYESIMKDKYRQVSSCSFHLSENNIFKH